MQTKLKPSKYAQSSHSSSHSQPSQHSQIPRYFDDKHVDLQYYLASTQRRRIPRALALILALSSSLVYASLSLLLTSGADVGAAHATTVIPLAQAAQAQAMSQPQARPEPISVMVGMIGTSDTSDTNATNTNTDTDAVCPAITWAKVVNVTATGNTIQKTGGVSYAWDAGAISTQEVAAGNLYAQSTADSIDYYTMFGLSHSETTAGYDDIDFAVYLAGGAIKVFELGNQVGTTYGTYVAGDVFKVAVTGNVVTYSKNDVAFYTSTATPVYPLHFDSSISDPNASILSAYLCTVPNTPTPTSTNTRTNTPTATRTPINTPTNTRTNTPTVRPGGSGITSNDPIPCSLWPADNIWNRRIDALPTHTRSNSYVSYMHASDPLHTGFASGMWQGQSIGGPYNVVPTQQPLVSMTFTDYPGQSDPGPYPYPTYATIQGATWQTPVPLSGDRHVSVLRAGSCTLYETWHAHPNPDGSWSAANGAVFNLASNALRPDGWTSADAAGFALLPGLVRYDEAQVSPITHAIRFTGLGNTVKTTHVWPARHSDGTSTSTSAPPMGTRFRLKASVNISSYPLYIRNILQGLKTYGMFLADSGDSWQIGGAPDQRWDDGDLNTWLPMLHGSDFEAVDESGLMIDPNSGQSR